MITVASVSPDRESAFIFEVAVARFVAKSMPHA